MLGHNRLGTTKLGSPDSLWDKVKKFVARILSF